MDAMTACETDADAQRTGHGTTGPLCRILELGAIVGMRLGGLLAVLAHAFGSGISAGPEPARTVQIAHAPGLPYRDFPVEFPPVIVAIQHAIGTNARVAAIGIALIAVTSDVVTTRLIHEGWGGRAALWYLRLSTPLFFLLYGRWDLLSVALAVGAVFSLQQRRYRLATVLLVLGVATKLWPIVLLMWFFRCDRRRGIQAAAAVGVFLVVWMVWAPAGPLQVTTFRGATGWQVESTAGAVLVLLGLGFRSEAGAIRVGSAAPVAYPFLGLAWLVWSASVIRRTTSAAAVTVSMVASALALVPLFSTQYVLWLLPWAAIAGFELPALAVSILTLLEAGAWWVDPHVFAALVVLRAAVLIGLARLAGRDVGSAEGGYGHLIRTRREQGPNGDARGFRPA